MSEVLRVEQYPNIVWSRITESDAEWINQAGQEVRTFMQRFRQIESTGKVINELDHLKMMLHALIATTVNPEMIQDTGIIEELVRRQKERALPERIASVAERLKALEVTEFGELYYGSLWIPEWVLENLDRFS